MWLLSEVEGFYEDCNLCTQSFKSIILLQNYQECFLTIRKWHKWRLLIKCSSLCTIIIKVFSIFETRKSGFNAGCGLAGARGWELPVPSKLIWPDIFHFPLFTLSDTFSDVFCCLCGQSDLAGNKVIWLWLFIRCQSTNGSKLTCKHYRVCECGKPDRRRVQMSCSGLPVNSIAERFPAPTPALIIHPEPPTKTSNQSLHCTQLNVHFILWCTSCFSPEDEWPWHTWDGTILCQEWNINFSKQLEPCCP